ncbi:MAG TPA: hypothetical protein VIQ31_34760 [Phormidium sp.]
MSKTNKKPVTVDKPGLTILALQRPDRPAVVDKPVKDEVISLPTTEEPVLNDAALPLPLSKKSSIEVTNTTESERSPDEEKPKKIINIDLVSKLKTEPNDDPLIGTHIQVTAPWGEKTLAEIVGSYIAPSGDKWVSFIPISECPAGWEWEGGVKRMSLLPLE